MRMIHRMMCLAVLILAAGCAAPPASEPPVLASPSPPPVETQPPAQPSGAAPQPSTAAGSASPAPTRTFVNAATPERETMPTSPAAPLPQDPALVKLIQSAIQDLAGRLNLPAAQIEFVQFEPVVWPDGSLGCPQPDMLYTQVQVEGYRIRLQANGQEYAYHGGGRRAPFLCENKTP